MTANPIDITVRTQYLAEQSRPGNDQYAFAYHITIRNRGAEALTLVSRHWLITDAAEKIQEVRGEGVVGVQPTIDPGTSYSYTSGVMLDTPVGTMEGSYHMLRGDGSVFETPIPVFLLAVPGTIN